MKVKYYGQSCLELELKGKKLLFDPFITPNELAKNIDVNQLNPDYILVSHGHQDHVADLETVVKNSKAQVITNFEIMNWLGGKGIEDVHPLNHGGSANFEFGRVKYTTAVHSSMLPDGSNGGNPGGFLITSDKGNVYFSGDTALTYDMKLIAEEARLDLAILPVGDNFTMGVEDAIKASDFIQCNKVLGVHYDTFPYIEIDHTDAKLRFQKAGKQLLLMDIGEELDL